jgi:hypothetical protein
MNRESLAFSDGSVNQIRDAVEKASDGGPVRDEWG